MLGPTHLWREQGHGCSPGLVVGSYPTFLDQAVEVAFIRVALPLVPVEVAPERERLVADATGEPGARLPSLEPLLRAGLAGPPSECHGGLPERPRAPVARHLFDACCDSLNFKSY